jgi:hypothetical protein
MELLLKVVFKQKKNAGIDLIVIKADTPLRINFTVS